MEKVKITICSQCEHFRSIADGPRTGVWYNLFCTAPEALRKESFDPQTGAIAYESVNSLGQRVVTEQKHPYCRDINPQGSCDFYRGP